MQRKLPEKPHLDHLRSQAKDLLDAQRRGDPEAMARIRAVVPAFANQSDDAIRGGPFALHDAQSAVAREYGFPSWVKLRDHVLGQGGTEEPTLPTIMRSATGAPLPPELQARVRDALLQRGAAAPHATPDIAPVLPLRNAVAFPGAVFPIDVGRPTTLRAIEVALERQPAFLAVFAQRASDTEQPTRDDLHSTGCLCVVLAFERPAQGNAWALLEGVRWVTLEALDQLDPHYAARVADVSAEQGDAAEIAALDRRLRDSARRLAATLPDIRDAALALIDATEDPAKLADLVMANLDGTVAEKAAYASETRITLKLENVLQRLDAELAKTAAPPA
jgi:Lon protease-like protein